MVEYAFENPHYGLNVHDSLSYALRVVMHIFPFGIK